MIPIDPTVTQGSSTAPVGVGTTAPGTAPVPVVPPVNPNESLTQRVATLEERVLYLETLTMQLRPGAVDPVFNDPGVTGD